ncbi:putative membrane protein [Streptomyces pseudovenezuelae]
MTGDMTQNSRSSGYVLGAATVATGLIAGAFYVFACAVMPALARSDDRVYVQVMRDINEVVQNPVFFLTFLGAPVLTAVAAWQARARDHRGWVRAALALSVLAFLVTVACNVPLNGALAHDGDPGCPARGVRGRVGGVERGAGRVADGGTGASGESDGQSSRTDRQSCRTDGQSCRRGRSDR